MVNFILHFHDTFFKISETFIHRQIAHHVKFKPICLCFKLINKELTPKNARVYLIPRSPIDKLRFASSLVSQRLSNALTRIPSLYEFYTKNIFSEKVDAIQTHFGNNLFYSIRLKRSLKKPLFTFFYGMDVAVLTKRYPRIYRYCSEYLEEAFVTSEFLRHKLKEHEVGVPIKVNRLGIDFSEWSYSDYVPPDTNEQIRIINIGRLVEMKGHEYLIGAIKILKDRGYKIGAIIIGDGPRKGILKYIIRKLGLSREVKLTGILQAEEVRKYLYSGNFFVFPSVVARDGNVDALGYACVEAMAAGLPVIASNVGGIPEYIIHNETGLLVQQRSSKQIAEAIEDLINNPRKARYISRKARRLVESEFDIRKNIEKLELEYLKYL
jgi:colanic acid/amylovoran biosynthesis glycosyltransferase